MSWNVYKCPFCGGNAPMGIMSLVARCEKCGARNTQMMNGKPTAWVSDPPASDAISASHVRCHSGYERRAKENTVDYFEQQMRKIVAKELEGLVLDPNSVAERIAHVLREQGYAQSTGIGGPAEYARSTE